MNIKWKIKKIKLDSIKEYKDNPRVITEKGFNDLKKSISKFGVAEPIVVNTDMTIIGGHGRKKVLDDINEKYVDCYVPNRKLTDNEVKELNVRFNKNIAGEWDFDILANSFEMDDLKEWGFTDEELTFDKDSGADDDEPSAPAEPIVCPKCGEVIKA